MNMPETLRARAKFEDKQATLSLDEHLSHKRKAQQLRNQAAKLERSILRLLFGRFVR